MKRFKRKKPWGRWMVFVPGALFGIAATLFWIGVGFSKGMGAKVGVEWTIANVVCPWPYLTGDLLSVFGSSALVVVYLLNALFYGCVFLLIRRAFRWFRPMPVYPDHLCKQCGYDLTGNISGRCPECNAAIDLNTLSND